MQSVTSLALLAGLLASVSARAGSELPLPPRAAGAPGGHALAQAVAPLAAPEREARLAAEILAGNVPDFLRRFVPVHAELRTAEGAVMDGTYHVLPDYLAVGSDHDSFLVPLSPAAAQAIAARLDCVLPTPKMVDDIYRAAAVKLAPAPIPPSPQMTTVPVFLEHSDSVAAQRAEHLAAHPLGALVAGHKKDVVLSARLAARPGRVAIYGWHRGDGVPIQPLYVGHTASWVDYSHGIRLVLRRMTVDGRELAVDTVLADPALCALLSDEGPVTAGYPAGSARGATPDGEDLSPTFAGEQTESFALEPEVNACIVRPAPADDGHVTELVFYALPNGNTTAQTIGKRLAPGDDWRFDIQHIGAQARFLRRFARYRGLTVAYLEAAGRSWPAWRREHDPQATMIPQLLERVAERAAPGGAAWSMSGHSGGGSLIFGYLDAVERVPDRVRRIAFLDSTYGYDPARGHGEKLAEWLDGAPEHALCVLAYNDNRARLDGKPIVSETGGTWYRSRLMRDDLARHFEFVERGAAPLRVCSALGGRVQFLLHDNPQGAILHTVQVERNGFIQSMLAGTPDEGAGYQYFGDRAYADLIAAP